jgi:cytochrome c556
MRLITKTAAFGLALFATVAIAADATDPAAKARQTLMDTIGMNMKTLGDMAGGKAAFDAAGAAAAKAAIVAASAEIPAKFETESADPASKATPKIWTEFDEFKEYAGKLNTAATGLDVASIEALQAGIESVGNACKECHTEFKAK